MYYFLTTKRKIVKCSIKNSISLEVDPSLISHFSFPKEDPSRCEVWIDNCGLSHLKEIDASILNKNYWLCSITLKKQAVENVANDDYETVEDCLQSCSTPDRSSAFLTMSISDVSTSTPASLTDRAPMKVKLRKKLFAETKRKKELKSVMTSNLQLAEDYSIITCLKVCEKYCSPTARLLYTAIKIKCSPKKKIKLCLLKINFGLCKN
ncbi:hypothetical protein AGLY_000825 [Aphis glycines]|uniref:THAP-type domain-containing protein n=1 Tax=Aphis glycines TaxID=307491 RepID=A0A6G0UAF5_APHGL|nr:hypothetical protein AGLY_000825 [Aphis glycines]